jgi:hypothetical protein
MRRKNRDATREERVIEKMQGEPGRIVINR